MLSAELISNADKPEKHEGLQNCPCCESSFVYPQAWEAEGNDWRIEFRCPECEWIGEGVHTDEEVEEYDYEMDRGTEAIQRDIKWLQPLVFEAEIEIFTKQLEYNIVLPEDFKL